MKYSVKFNIMKKALIIALISLSISASGQVDSTYYVDVTILDWGKHSGKRLMDLSAKYLLDLYDKDKIPPSQDRLRVYIINRLHDLRMRAASGGRRGADYQ